MKDKILSRVYTLNNPNDLILREEFIELDKLSNQHIVCETVYSAISPGTEVAAFRGLPALRPGNMYPRILGYCNLAKVIYVGEEVTCLKSGDYILTFQSHRSHFVITDKDFFIKIDKENDLKKITSTYLFHLGYHSLLTADVKFGYNIGVIGAGTLGYSTSVLSNVAGSRTFVFSNQLQAQKKIEETGSFFLLKNSSYKDLIKSETNGVGLDVIINTSNSWDDWFLALDAIQAGGTIVNLGFPGRGEQSPKNNPLEPQFVYQKFLNIKALSYLSDKDLLPQENRFTLKNNLNYLISLINSGKIDSKEIFTDEIIYSELNNQYIKYCNKNTLMLSTLLIWKN